MKKLLLLLCCSANVQTMNSKDAPSLVSICIQKITKDLHKAILSEQSDLLAQKIDTQVPLTSLKKYSDWLNVPPEEQLDLSMAITTLNKISTISHECGLLKISPISIEIKYLPEELAHQIVRPHAFESVPEIQKLLFEQLYAKSAVIKRCLNLYMHYQGSWDLIRHRTAIGGDDIPVVMQLFATKKNLEAREAREKEFEKKYRFDDSRCP